MDETMILRCDEPWIDHVDPAGETAPASGCLDEWCELARGLHPVAVACTDVACTDVGCVRGRTDVVLHAA